jgi:DNA-directed RNA polymerase subunit RPC12/RpoP
MENTFICPMCHQEHPLENKHEVVNPISGEIQAVCNACYFGGVGERCPKCGTYISLMDFKPSIPNDLHSQYVCSNCATELN